MGAPNLADAIWLYGAKKEQLTACADCSTWNRPTWRRPTWMIRYVPLSTTDESPTDEEEGQLLATSASDEGSQIDSQIDEASPAVSRRKIGADAA